MRGKFIFPLPPKFPNPLIHIVIEGAKYLWNKFTSKKEETSEKISKQGAMQEGKESIDEIVIIHEAFNSLIQGLDGDIQKTEDDAIKELSYFFEEFIDYMQENEVLFAERGIRVNKITNKFEKVKRKLRGELSKKIHKEISLDNIECREILAMRAGDRKKEKMNAFIENTFEKVLQDFIDDIKEEILEVVEDIELAMQEGIELTEFSINEKASACQQLEEDIRGDIHHKADIMSQAIFKIYMTEEIKAMSDEEEA